MRATGLKPRLSATSARASTSAAAPSEIEEEFAAVTVPSLAKAGLSMGILAGSALRGCSSDAISTSPPRMAIFTGTISSVNEPSSCACLARISDWVAKASCCSRVNW